ncbi:outer membrane protein [Breznakibacter xylanolyticus]|uniref:Outer membrane protein n=1 Tax=Breznakibacter xylanolyticus TaxID=990 RepID=A0A2W7NHS4_9BACT|nr:TolC family protein [Breznakibacter xylanolyticus]PZX10822.1 outer membrane protein [Breznakibacter xylanolyticus]
MNLSVIKPIGRWVSCAWLTMVPLSMAAQSASTWTLEQCVAHAYANNLSVRQQQMNAQYTQNQYEQKQRYGRLPTVNASSTYSIGFGRVQLQSEFRYVDQTTHNGSVWVEGSMPLFQGMTLNNTIHKREAEWQAAMQKVAVTQNDMALTIATYYLQILFDKELLVIANQQLEVTRQQAERAKVLVDKGSAAPNVYYELKAQAAREAMNVTVQENNLMLSRLNLAQLLDLEDVEGFDVMVPVLPDMPPLQADPAQNIYQQALDVMPEIKGAAYRVESSAYDLKIARGNLYPSLSAFGGWNSGIYYVKGIDFDFSEQFKNNANSYVGLTLRIPIFNNMEARYGVKNATIGLESARLDLENEKMVLRKKVQQAWADANAAWKKYESGREAVVSYEESFRQAESRFNVGLLNAMDYSTVKNDYIRAQSEWLQAKYECILRNKVLDFYKGEKIVL